MNILYCKDLWWPFGSHLMHTMHRKIYCDMNGYKLLYAKNNNPAYSLYEGRLDELFSSISDIKDVDIINFAEKIHPDASLEKHYLLKYTEEKNFKGSVPISYNDDIGISNWHEFKPDEYASIEEYRSDVMKKLAEPSDNIKKYLANKPFIQEVLDLNQDYIAIHIRWTDKVNGWCTETDFYDVDVYFKYAVELREKYGTNNIVLNCDNLDALTKFVNYNINNYLRFNIIYDKEEHLPSNDWKECIFQKSILNKGSIKPKEFINDLLNGFKIYKTIFEANSVVCNYFSNMALAPCIARNCSKDVNISNKIPYAIFPAKYWPRDMFTDEVISRRLEGYEVYKKIKNNKT